KVQGAEVHKAALERALAAFSVPGLPVRKQSQGQRRRAALSRLLLSESVRLWLLDEPFAALDTAAATYMEELVGRHLAAGGAVVYTTHQPTGIDARARVVQL